MHDPADLRLSSIGESWSGWSVSDPDARRALRRDLRDLLASLGDAPEAIADTLERLDVRGCPGSSAGCALAAFLNALATADPRVGGARVTRQRAVLKSASDGHRVAIRLSRAQRAFVRQFDAGAHPRLVRGEGAPLLRPQARRPEGPDRAVST